MVKRFQILIFISAALFLLLGCGQKIKSKVFNTPKNNATSQNFPAFQADSQQKVETRPSPLPSILTHGSRNKKWIALTFDADMTPKMLKDLQNGKVKSLYDTRITNTLEKNKVASTLFITGLWAQTYPDAVRMFAQNPLYEIANHSFDHKAFAMPCYGLPSAENKQKELAEPQEILFDLTGKKPKFFRFPGGCSNADDVRLAQNTGLQVVGWDVISGDAFLKDSRKITQEVLQKAQNGSIVVMHLDGGPNSPATALALPGIIEGLQKKGFRFVTVSELLLEGVPKKI